MSDPFEVPAYQRQGFVESPVVSPRMAQQPTAQEMKLKEIVTALNEVATARKNEAEAIQQQLDKLAQDYERMRQDNEGLRAQLVPTAVATSSSTSTAAHELNRALQENDVLRARVADLEAQQYLQQQQLQQALQSQHMSSVAPASIPSLPASQPAPTSAPPVVHSTSTLPITTVPPLNRMKGALGGVVVNILLLCIAAMYLSSGTAEGARMPVALAVKGGLSHVVEHAVAVEDVLLNVTTEHFNENIEGGPVTLLGNLVEQGYTVNPPKSWRVMVAVAQGLDPDLDIARTRGSAKALVQGTCWECMETIEAGSFTTMFVVLLVTELILIVTAIFLKPSVLKAPVEVKLQEEALPAIMLPKGVSVHRTWVSPEDANCREVTLQFVAETALTSIVGKDLELCTFTVNTANGRVAGLSVDKKRIVNPASCQSLNGRPVLWLVNNAPPVLSEVNTCPAVEYTPASLATYQATRSDLDSASADASSHTGCTVDNYIYSSFFSAHAVISYKVAMDGHEPVLGIDLGTTNSCVGVWDWKQETVRIISTDEGDRTIPSIVCFNKGDVLVGAAAKRKLTSAPKTTIYNSKRVIGRPFGKLRQCDLDRWTFDVVSEDGRPRYKVLVEGEEKLISPEEVGALVLAHLKELAEKTIGEEVTKVVVTVPAYFTEPQRRATRDAGLLAGLDVIRILPEPTAAALAFGLDRKAPQVTEGGEAFVLVFDMGGGTFDVSILALDGRGSFVTKAVTGDFHLGGEDFDDLLVEWAIAHPMVKQHISTVTPKFRQKLRKICEAAKRDLSNSDETCIEIEVCGEEAALELTRDTFNSLCSELFDNAMGEVLDALDLAGIGEADISNIVLVGGSTRIPRLQEMLKQKFTGKRLWCGMNPDEAVAWGATALAAATISGRKQTSGATAPAQSAGAAIPLRNLTLTSITPITLGIELSDGTMDVLIPKGTKIPSSRSDDYTTAIASQRSVVIQVFEGECTTRAKDNYMLGKFSLPVEDAAAGVPMIKVTFEITADGLFLVTARDTKNKKEITVKLENSNLTGDEKNQIVAAVGTERGRLRAFISHVYGKASAADHQELMTACSKLLEWLHSYPEASKTEITTNHNRLEELTKAAGLT